MNVKIENQDNFTVLVATGPLAANELPILKAGLTKLFQSGHKVVVLDLVAVPAATLGTPEALAAVASLRTLAGEKGAQLLIASPVTGIGDAAQRDDAIARINSPLGRLLALEKRLVVQIKKVEQHKVLLEQKIAHVEKTTGNIMQLRRENVELKRRLSELEELVRARLLTRLPPFTSELNQHQFDTAARILTSAMEKQGAIAKP